MIAIRRHQSRGLLPPTSLRSNILLNNHPAFSIFFKFVLLDGYAAELKNFLSRWSAESRVFLSRCISRERSEDTLQRLLEKVNRVPLHEDFHFRVTNGQRAEVKRACTAREYLCFPRPLRHQEFVCLLSVSPQQIQIFYVKKLSVSANLELKFGER